MKVILSTLLVAFFTLSLGYAKGPLSKKVKDLESQIKKMKKEYSHLTADKVFGWEGRLNELEIKVNELDLQVKKISISIPENPTEQLDLQDLKLKDLKTKMQEFQIESTEMINQKAVDLTKKIDDSLADPLKDLEYKLIIGFSGTGGLFFIWLIIIFATRGSKAPKVAGGDPYAPKAGKKVKKVRRKKSEHTQSHSLPSNVDEKDEYSSKPTDSKEEESDDEDKD